MVGGVEIVFRNMISVSGGDVRREGVLLSTCTRIEAVANRESDIIRNKIQQASGIPKPRPAARARYPNPCAGCRNQS